MKNGAAGTLLLQPAVEFLQIIHAQVADGLFQSQQVEHIVVSGLGIIAFCREHVAQRGQHFHRIAGTHFVTGQSRLVGRFARDQSLFQRGNAAYIRVDALIGIAGLLSRDKLSS